MAMQYNFQPLTFADYNGMEREANRRYYDSLGSIGGTIAKTGEKVDSYLQRKQKEEEDKKKWDNMIAQQEYQKEQDRINREYQDTRDAIADARYNEEQRLKKEEARHAVYKEMNNRAAIERYREGLKKSYTPEFLEKYGPTAQADYEAAMTAPTLAEAVASGRNLGQGIYQQDLLDFQREQSERSNKQDEQTKIAGNIMNSIRRQESNSKFSFDIQGKLPNNPAELKAYRDEVQANLDFLRKNEQYADYDVGFHDRIKKYKTILDAIDGKQNYKKPKSDTDKALEAYYKSRP